MGRDRERKSLIVGCRRGDKAARDAFVLQYSNLVYHKIRKTLTPVSHRVPSEVVEDLYQEFVFQFSKVIAESLVQSARGSLVPRPPHNRAFVASRQIRNTGKSSRDDF
jgi:hypothetical protein